MSSKLPFEMSEAVVNVCGRAFWLKDPFRSFLVSCGVPTTIYDRYSEESKYKIARHVLSELEQMGEDGYLIQRRIITELCKLRKVPDDNVPDREAALAAIRWLKQLAVQHNLLTEEKQTASDSRATEAKRKQAALAARAQKTEQLRSDFMAMSLAKSQEEIQRRGYDLEELLAQLFELNEVSYRRSYRTGNEQIDGHFNYKGFDYLVEAKWRSKPPDEGDLVAFRRKVDKKLSSTRGLFMSIAGFRQDIVLELTRGATSNIVLIDGSDLALILEGHVSLTDALDLKIQKAAQEGILLFPLSQRYSQ